MLIPVMQIEFFRLNQKLRGSEADSQYVEQNLSGKICPTAYRTDCIDVDII